MNVLHFCVPLKKPVYSYLDTFLHLLDFPKACSPQSLYPWPPESVLYIDKNCSSGRYSLSLPLVSLAWGGSPCKANTAQPADLFTWWINQRGWRCWVGGGAQNTERTPPLPHHNDRTLVHYLHMPLWRVSVFRGKITQPPMHETKLHITQCTLLWPVLLSSPRQQVCIRAACLCTLVWPSGVQCSSVVMSHYCLWHRSNRSFHPSQDYWKDPLCVTGS